jgi:hypothetical protein
MHRQHGVISRRQALDVGLSSRQIERLVRSGEWQRVDRGVYRHALVRRSWRADLVAACLISGGLASHRAAAALHGVHGIAQGVREIIVPRGWTREVPWLTVHESKQFALAEPLEIDGIPCTDLGRTVLDLGAVVDERRLDQAIDALVREKRIDLRTLATVWKVHSRRGRDGCGKLREALERRMGEGGIPRSQWSRDAADLLVAHQLPKPAFEYPVLSANGGFLGEVDLAYPEAKLAIELDSIRWHLSRVDFEDDAVRRNRMIVIGWQVLNFTYSEFRDHPTRVVQTVRDALRLRNPRSGRGFST